MATNTYTCTISIKSATSYSGTYYAYGDGGKVGKNSNVFFRTKIEAPSGIPAASEIESATLTLNVSDHGASTGTFSFGLYEAYGNSGYTTANVAGVTKSIKISSPGSTVSLNATTFLQAGITSLMFLPTSEPPYNSAWIEFSSATLSITTKSVSYTLSYDLQGGDGTISSQTGTGEDSVSFTISSTVPTRDGYSFEGWATSAGGAVSYQPSETITVTGDVTLYAVWSAQTCTVTFDANGGTVSPTTMTVTYGQAYGTLPTPTRTTGTFSGWYYGDTLITSTSIVSTLENHTLVADWGMTSPFYMKMTDGSMKPAFVFRKTESGMSQCTVYTIDEDGALTN